MSFCCKAMTLAGMAAKSSFDIMDGVICNCVMLWLLLCYNGSFWPQCDSGSFAYNNQETEGTLISIPALRVMRGHECKPVLVLRGQKSRHLGICSKNLDIFFFIELSIWSSPTLKTAILHPITGGSVKVTCFYTDTESDDSVMRSVTVLPRTRKTITCSRST